MLTIRVRQLKMSSTSQLDCAASLAGLIDLPETKVFRLPVNYCCFNADNYLMKMMRFLFGLCTGKAERDQPSVLYYGDF